MEGRMKLGKRLCAWMLCAAMVMGFVPGPAQADSNSETNNTEVWSGSKAISWDGGTSWETQKTDNSMFSSISDGSTILIDTDIYTIDDDTVKCDIAYYKDGNSWQNLVTNNSNGTISYSVTTDTLASIQANGLRIQGGTFTVSKIRICKTAWTGNEKISWNPNEVPGTQYEATGIFTGLAVGDIIRVSTTKTEGYDNDPQYVVTYKAGSGWTWTDLETTFSEGVITYTVNGDQIAKEIAERGLTFRGQGWTATQITVNEEVVWSETESFTRVPGTQFDTKGKSQPDTVKDMFNDLKQGDIITVSTAVTEDCSNPQYTLTYKAGDSWVWTDLTVSVSDVGTITYTVESDEIANDIAGHGLVFRGQAYTITRITVTKPEQASSPEETVLWTGDVAISWNSSSYAGVQFDTYYDPHKVDFAGLAKNDTIQITVSPEDGAQYAIDYKTGNNWDWTSLTSVAGPVSGILSYKVETDEIATLITQRGIVIKGIKFHIKKISVVKGSSEEADPTTNPANTYAVDFATAPDGIPLSVFHKSDGTEVSGPVNVATGESLSFTVAGTYHNTDTGDYYKLQKVENGSSTLTASDGAYTVNDAASIKATYEKLNWKLTCDGGVTSASLVEDEHEIPTVTFSAPKWSSVYLSNKITANSGDNGLSVTISNNRSAADFELTAELENDKVTKSVNLPNGETTILFPFGKTLSGGTFKLTIKAGRDGVADASLTVKAVEPVTLHTLTVSNPFYHWGNAVILVNDAAVNTNNDNKQGTAGVIAGTNAILKMKNSDSYYVKRVTVDGKVVNIGTAQDDVYTYTLENVSADHTIVVTYEYSGTSITPEKPAVETTEVATTTSDDTATVSDSVATTVTGALDEHKAAGITATSADNVELAAGVVSALATNESNKGDDGIVAVIETKNVTVEAPAAMFSSAKDGDGASVPVTLMTEKKEANAAAGDGTIAAAVAATGETGTFKGAVDVSLVNTSSTEEIKVDLGESGAKPITIKTKIEKSLYKNQLRVGYIKGDKLVFDDTVRLTAYDKNIGEVAFTTTHFTTFVVVSGNEFVWNFNSGLDGWSFGWANDYDGKKTGHSYTDAQKAEMVSLSGGALKLSLDYTKTPSKENPWPSFTVQYSGEDIPLSGKNYLSMDVYYNAGALGGSTLLFALGPDKLITADTAQLNTYAAADATIDGRTMKKTTVLIGFKRDVSNDNNELNIDVINTSGTYNGNVYLDNITIGTASHFITTSINEDYRGAFIPGGRVPMLGETTTIYVVQKASDQRIAKLTLDGKTVSGASGKTTYQFTYENDTDNHTLIAEFEWFDANGSAGLVVSSGEVFRAELTNPVAAVGEKLVQPEAEVKNGKLATVISEKEISDIIAEVETAEKSEKTDVITIIPYVKDRKTEVTRTEVALPAASVSELAEKTGAALRVETVVAAITIPNEALKEIGSEGGIIAVAAERAEEYMELSVTANGSRLTDIRGGISASVPMECGPGTVAMLAEDELRTRSELVNRSAGHGSEADPVEKDNPTESVEGKPLLYSAANSQGTAMTVLLPGSARIRFVHQAKRFTDVPEVSWASGAVDFVSSHRIFGGYDDGAFYPNSVMNRAMLVQVLYNMSERPAAEHGSVFADVPSGAWFADAVNWASGTRVVRGYGDGTFAPGATITRQDAVVILYRYAGEPECEDTDLSRFEDEDRIGTYARKAIQWAVSRRLLNGVSASQLAPGAELTRYQAAKLLMNYVQDRVG